MAIGHKRSRSPTRSEKIVDIQRFVCHGSVMSTDHFTKHGAAALAMIITDYWVSRGFMTVHAERFAINAKDWGVRSNLIAGLPPSTRKGKTISERRREFLR